MPPKKAGPSPQLELWLQKRIDEMSRNVPLYEASWYGPYNAVLCHFFPYTKGFMVKPQPKLRRRVAINPGESISNVSFASAGYPVSSPEHHNIDLFIPDFIVAKATESLNSDKSLLHVEVKVSSDGSAWPAGKVQLHRYMSRHVQSEGSTIYGILICGGEAEIYRKGSDARTRIHLVGKRCSVNEKGFLDFLYNIAVEHW